MVPTREFCQLKHGGSQLQVAVRSHTKPVSKIRSFSKIRTKIFNQESTRLVGVSHLFPVLFALPAYTAVLTDRCSPARLAFAASTAVLTDRCSPALLACVAFTAVLTDRCSPALLALAACTAVLTDRCSPALLAFAALTAMIAMPLPLLRPHPPLFEPAVLQQDLLVPFNHLDRADFGDTFGLISFATTARHTKFLVLQYFHRKPRSTHGDIGTFP